MPSFMDALKRNLHAVRPGEMRREPGPGLEGADWLAQQPQAPRQTARFDGGPELYTGEGWNNPHDQARRAETYERAAAADVNDRAAPERGVMRQMGTLIRREGITPETRKQIVGRLTEIGKPPIEELVRDPDAAFNEKKRMVDYEDSVVRRRASEVTPTTRVQVRRWAEQDAADRYEAMKDQFGLVPEGTPSVQEMAAQLEEEYASMLEPGRANPRQTQRVIGNLRQILPGPVGSRQTIQGPLRPIGSGAASVGGDAYEQYLAQTRGR